jgi:hypothetical protein
MVYFGEAEGPMYDALIEVARESENIMFYNVPTKCAATHGSSDKSVAFFRSFDESPIQYKGLTEAKSLIAFGEFSSKPAMIEFSEET